MSLFFLPGVTVIMLVGAGSLMNELFGIPQFIGSACLTILLAWLSLRGIKGVLLISQMVVPILLVHVVIISVWSCMIFEPEEAFGMLSQEGNPLLRNWFLATLSFFS